MHLRLRMIEGRYGIARLAAEASIPAWADGPGFMSVVRTDDELTVVCLENRIPENVQSDRGWVCLRTVGPFDFGTTGVVQALIEPLSSNGIGIFVVCTFDGEHLLIPHPDEANARNQLIKAGHFIEG